jgi:hypothetical protein
MMKRIAAIEKLFKGILNEESHTCFGSRFIVSYR